MKRIITLSIICTICCLIVDCTRIELESDESDSGCFCVYAAKENFQSTKTELQADNSIAWMENDAISFFPGSGVNGGYKLVAKEIGENGEALFMSDNMPDVVTTPYWAVYPYNETAICDGSSITTTLPSKQTAKRGSFDDDLFISIARSDSNKMTFYNVCGGIKFSVSRDGIKEVVLKNNDGGLMSGTMKISFDEDGIPAVNSITDGKSSINVTAPDGGAFVVGEVYYAVIPPLDFSKGITMKFLTQDGKEANWVISSSSSIERSKFTRLLQKDSGVTFKHCPYLTFMSEGESTLKVSNGSKVLLEYSFDRENWQRLDCDAVTLTFTKNSPLCLRGVNSKIYPAQFVIEGNNVACYGDIMKLLDYSKDVRAVSEQCFKNLFKECHALVHSPELPATTLAKECYSCMFYFCRNLVAAPELPATVLAESCYFCMFRECYSLKNAPKLPATSLAPWCYADMFGSCPLTVAPQLPATVLAEDCYKSMFSLCRSLTIAPELPATTLVAYCYSDMFNNCTSLTVAPELPATVLARGCYVRMFAGSAIETTPKLPATTLAPDCYASMFAYCKSLKSASDLSATTLAANCYLYMFQRCDSLTAAPKLPAMTLAKGCYSNMFQNCKSLTTAPQLPATTLAADCYSNMFQGCKSLTTAPQLPATTLAATCYSSMFEDCSSLVNVQTLPALYLVDGCYYRMFSNCEKLDFLRALFIEADDCSVSDAVGYWLNNVADNGMFIKNGASKLSKSDMCIPDGWTVSELN